MKEITFQRFSKLFGVIVLCVASGCTIQEPGVYRGGQLIHPAPLGIEDQYSFRFVDRWKISHRWLSGPTHLRGCAGYPLNPFRRLGGYGELGAEINAPIVERNGHLSFVGEHNQKWTLNEYREAFYGLDGYGKFTRFSALCGAAFSDSLDAMGLYIVKPDPAKGTDQWVTDAKEVTINGLRWRHKEIPIQDWSESRESLSGPIEFWVLEIPETKYWLALRFSATSSAKFGMGADAYPEKHRRLLELFREIVQSVRLEPISPINIDGLVGQK
ncbi:MAG: hypothetical protein J0I15_18330 [Herbaspirillum huttiense]|uniref:hypothetical protein n=1 Tax=Herbaspirillum huttiense TaxID=863372 RepID=UPI001AC6EB8C|nr:hypothetical protein [Herbaspirillum huttiense]MBN9358409.1 hypothetical protein [Herbaspirillum huttiense]